MNKFAQYFALGLGSLLGLLVIATAAEAARTGLILSPTGGAFVGGALTLDTSLGDNVELRFGDGTDYWMAYRSGSTEWDLQSTDCDGGGTDCQAIAIPDGTTEIRFFDDNAGNTDVYGGGASNIRFGDTAFSFRPAGTNEIQVNANGLVASSTDGGGVINETASTTNPTLTPDRTNLASGVGCAGDDVCLINNGTTALTTSGGETDIAGVSADGSGSVVCVKADGDLGTCTDAPDGSGNCTCS